MSSAIVDIEDCDSTLINATAHKASYHFFSAHEIDSIHVELLSWYHKYRRKLPWRGDKTESGLFGASEKQEAAKLNQHKNGIAKYFINSKAAKPAEEEIKEIPVAEAAEAAEAMDDEDSSIRSSTYLSSYHTWISEIMLQQTRVEAVLGYFQRWMARFPTIHSLAAAKLEEINTLWSGLGYYRRARFIHEAAQSLVKDFNGELPSTVEELLKIPGIGRYTAGAIASVAFNRAAPIVDGNVIRVLCRARAIDSAPSNRLATQLFWQLAQELIETCKEPGNFNQALMELGATVCTPKAPNCSNCPVRNHCKAYREVQGKQRPTEKKYKCQPDGFNSSDFDAENSVSSEEEEQSDVDEERPIKNHKKAKVRNAESKENLSKNQIAAAILSNPEIYCNFCDAARTCAPSSVMEYPAKAEKKRPTDEFIAVSVVSRARANENSMEFCIIKRSEEGLLAGQFEFPALQLEQKVWSNDKQREAASNSFLQQQLSSQWLNMKILERRQLGEIIHIFSHRKHFMKIEIIEAQFNDSSAIPIASKRKALEISNTAEKAAEEHSPRNVREIRWLTAEELTSLGLTSGIKKVFKLVNSATKAVAHKPKASSSGAKKKATAKSGLQSDKKKRQKAKEQETVLVLAAEQEDEVICID
jgi:A/G-specific adenine glycosylase